MTHCTNNMVVTDFDFLFQTAQEREIKRELFEKKKQKTRDQSQVHRIEVNSGVLFKFRKSED